MLTALGDFVDDSVGDDSGGSLDAAQVGEDLRVDLLEALLQQGAQLDRRYAMVS